MPTSPFLDRTDHVASNDLAFAIRDAFPVSPGHTLIVPRRVVPTWFDATPDEQRAIFAVLDEVRRDLDLALRPDGYNVGFNAGPAAGQTVMHLHVHVIPRFLGDMDDPRGGVRHVIPSKGNYLLQAAPLATGGDDPFSRHVLPLLERADEVAIVAAFVQQRGLDRIAESIASTRAKVRILTGDYLNITQVEALETLLDWQSGFDDGRVEARVIEVDAQRRSFHPKSWWFEGEKFGVAFVGSSNLSWEALERGIEWNLRVDRDRDRVAWTRIKAAFEDLWDRARVLDAAWIADYARRARTPLPTWEIADDPLPPPDPPHEVQVDALSALRAAREDGRRRALVILATGLGKTWLSAFDYAQLWDELGRPPRLLFVAHRVEILRQAAQTFRRLLRERGATARVGWFVGDEGDLDADLVFASVAKLSRHLKRLDPQRFDYVVIDEVHHAAAESYRRILAHLDPGFLLGLTATPDRADAADILGLFDDFVAFRADIGRGIAIRRLVPFNYFGLKDTVDYRYENIPWRNHRFDPEALAAAVQTEARMSTMWTAWQAHPGARSLVFCCSIAHARYVRDWLRHRGVRAAAVFADPSSDDRDGSLKRLAAGELDAICAVDVFNEGVDVPALDRVVMLRPTESGVVFLQQLGRGLRANAGKEALTVIDFVGNHRVFLERLRTLLSLGSDAAAAALRALLDDGKFDLPAGCSVDVELGAIRLLEDLFRVGGADAVERAYRELKVVRGRRPTAGELLRMGYVLKPLRERHGGWFRFVAAEGDLPASVLDTAGAFLDELEITEMTKSFKMVTLEALIEADALNVEGLDLRTLALRANALLQRSPELLADVPNAERLTGESEAEIARWVAYWRRNPVEAWTAAKKSKRTWFRLVEGRLVFDGPASEGLVDLVRELVDWRLAQYRRRTQVVAEEGFVCKVLWNQRDPILKLPDRARRVLPAGETDVRRPDGSVWMFRFAREYCNVARPPGSPRNHLPDLLREWFGPQAGMPGTAFEVRFTASPDGLWVEPLHQNVLAFTPRRGVIAYPDLRAAAGHASGEISDPATEPVLLPFDGADDVFAVRVTGTSMEPGLRDGDWAVMRWARGLPVSGRVALVQVPGVGEGHRFQIKRVTPAGQGWRLTSDNPEGPAFDADEGMVVVARLERAITPEELAPAPGVVEREGLFGLELFEPVSGRQGGHLFIVIAEKGVLVAPDRVRFAVARRPGETAFVLTRTERGLRYVGVGRWREDEGLWAIPEVDFASWRALGEGRKASRTLPEGALSKAQRVVDAVIAAGRIDGAVVVGRAARGGLRIKGEGAGERTVSLVDIAWVVVAAEDVREKGGVLDEERVNRLRYLEGTPKGSTRWIDTGWGIAAWEVGGW